MTFSPSVCQPLEPGGGTARDDGKQGQWAIPAAGLGKTTLAHVVARHCGYRPVEINASDDRTGPALHTRITDAAQMTSVVAPSKKPNCIIIDEIDGVAGDRHAACSTCPCQSTLFNLSNES